jgi:two-component system OmpR family response regulator
MPTERAAIDLAARPSENGPMSAEPWGAVPNISVPVNLVLIVEDDPEAAEFMKGQLERHHVKVRIAKDGGQAQATFSMHKPDFVILDLILPGESGFEICERFKSADAAVPVLVVSEMDREDSRELAQRVGADGYLTKPLDPQSLVEMVREIAERVWQKTHGDAEVDTTRIRFTCVCGKKFKVSSTHRGKTLTCPQCGEPLTVPRR